MQNRLRGLTPRVSFVDIVELYQIGHKVQQVWVGNLIVRFYHAHTLGTPDRLPLLSL